MSGVRLPLRWQATGPGGTLFPALDADLTLSPAGEETAVLTLAGVCRLPDQAGAGLDPAIVRCFADVTIRRFMARLACALTHPAGTAVPAGRARPENSCREPSSMPSGCRIRRIAAAVLSPPRAAVASITLIGRAASRDPCPMPRGP
jgi:hypothetical protein